MSDRAALVAAGILHVVLVVSVAVQPLDGQVPASSWRFPTAPLHFDAVTWPEPEPTSLPCITLAFRSGAESLRTT